MKIHHLSVGFPALCAVVGITPAAAQRGAPTPLTLERARTIAAERAPAVVAARARAAISAGAEREASMLLPFNPELTAGAGSRFGPTTSMDLDASVTQRFEIGGQRGDRIDRAHADVEMAEALALDQRRRSVTDTSIAFARVLFAEASLDARAESASVAKSLLDSVQRRYEVGEIGGLDVNVAAVVYTRATAAKKRSAAALARSLGRLRGLLGFEPHSPIVTKGQLARLPEHALEQLMIGIESRPDLAALRFEMQSASAESSLGAAAAWPDLGLTFHYGREEGSNILGGGLSVFLPLFDHGQGPEVRGAKRLRAARLEYEATLTSARAELAGDYEAYQHLRAAITEYEESTLPLLRENLERSKKAYQTDAIPIGELLVIQREMVTARLAYVDLLLEANVTAFEIESKAGFVP